MTKHLYLNAFFWLLVFNLPATAQEAVLTGTVKNRQGEALVGATVQLGVQNQAAMADNNGKYTISQIPSGQYNLSVSYLGFKIFTQKITLAPKQTLRLPVVLQEQESALSEVEITGKTETRKLKESPYTISSLDARQNVLQTASTAGLLNQVSGVRVLQTGGLGSRADIAINGISGKQVRFFIDGIPLEFYGSGYNLNTVPLHLVERIEVYKGLVPANLGADALGGAMQIITKPPHASSAGATYSIGSFNTHKAALDLNFVPDTTGFVAGISAYYNHSDNNYKVNVDVINDSGNPEKISVPRFHDQFSNYLMQARVGWLRTGWADVLQVQGIISGETRQKQHGFTMNQAYGQVEAAERSQGVQLNYRKSLWRNKLQINLVTGLNHIRENYIDTTLFGYTWQGEKIYNSVEKKYFRRSFGGESSGTQSSQLTSTRQTLNRLNIVFQPGLNQRINLNILQTNLTRTGEDLLAADFFEQDLFELPTYVHKINLGLTYERDWLTNRLTSISALKFFRYRSAGFNFEKEAGSVKAGATRMGGSQAFKFTLSDKIYTKASYEYATRLPDDSELLGSLEEDVNPNPGLKPETSHNVNTGLYYNKRSFTSELNLFYRYVDDNIFLPPSNHHRSRYGNLFLAQFAGIEAEGSSQLNQNWKVTLNGTYQDIRNKTPASESGSDGNRYYNARRPNIPYLFGNLELHYLKPDFLRSGHKLQAWWRTQYVNWFYLNWSIDGHKDDKTTIPTQVLHTVGLGYSLRKNTLHASVEATNITNASAYDNYSVQRPGRMLNAKVSYLLQKN